MEDIYKILSKTGKAWNVRYTDRNSFDVTEFWKADTTGSITVENHPIGSDPQSRKQWFTQRTRESESLILRLVWLAVDVELRQVDISEPVEKEIIEEFGIKLAHSYFKTFTSGITALPKLCTDDFERQAFAFCFAPKLASLWSHTRSKPDQTGEVKAITQAIMFIKATPKTKTQPAFHTITTLKSIISNMPWDPRICLSPAVPALMLSLLLGQQIQQTQSAVVGQVQEVESRTKFHDFHHHKQPAPVELESLSAKTSGYATRLASVSRKTAMAGELLNFIRNIESEEKMKRARTSGSNGAPGAGSDEISLLQHNVQVLQQRLDMQKLETDFLRKRVEVQLQAVLHLVAQDDSKASQRIAFYSYRESSNMKTLAFVTMLFLPGSFVSALFSTNFFAWDDVDLTKDDIGVPMTPQLALYWIITIPLTLLTFIFYFMWLRVQKPKHQRELEEVRKGQGTNSRAADAETVNAQPTAAWQTENASMEKQRVLMARSSSMSYYNQPSEV